MNRLQNRSFYLAFATLLLSLSLVVGVESRAEIDDIVLASAEISTDASGPQAEQRWASILCKFADVDSEPAPAQFFKDMFERTSGPSLSSYWNEVSYGNISSLKTDVFGWYTLAEGRGAYNFGGEILQFEYDKLLADCVAAAAGDVNVNSYDYYAIFLNSPHGVAISNIGSSGPAMPSNKFNLATMPHEMGHTYGLPHSFAGGSQTSNVYDLMSAHRHNCSAQPDPIYLCVAQHPIAHYKVKMGHIDIDKQYTGTGTKTITLERLALPQSDNFLIAYVENPDTGARYTVEARQRVGYDSKLPHDGIVIHKLEQIAFDTVPALVDADNNGVYDDEGAIWKPGETFNDGNGIQISVLASTGSGYEIKIVAPGASVNSDLVVSHSAPQPGDEIDVTLTVSNSGDKASSTLSVKLTNPNDVSLVPGSLQTTAGTVDEANLFVNISALAPNQSVTVTYKYKVDSGLTGPTALVGSAEILNDLLSPIETLPVVAVANPIQIFLPTIIR